MFEAMNPPKLLRCLFVLSLVITGGVVRAQVEVKGTVYDISAQYPLRGVSVLATSGRGTVTDSSGHYRIVVPSTDSLSFSYLGRATSSTAVRDLPQGYPFDISLHVAVDTLPTATVWNRSYELDSLENRKEYQKAFDYNGSALKNMKMSRGAGFGVGLDFDMLFNHHAVKRMEALQDRLIWQEHDNYIDHRWNRAIVKRVTGLDTPVLDTFMRQYRPSYEFIQSCETEYEFYKYIQEWAKFFVEDWNNAHKDAMIKVKETTPGNN
jgi:hypothetical protein